MISDILVGNKGRQEVIVSTHETALAELETDRSQWTLHRWLDEVRGENGLAIRAFMSDADHKARVDWAPGSRDAHHAWEGGYAEHLRQTMWIAAHNFELFDNSGRLDELPEEEEFDLSDALTVLFLHDIEKPFIYEFNESSEVVKTIDMPKPERKAFRQAMIRVYGFDITPTMENALLHVEGVRDEHYVPGKRADQPLAALVHAADNLSARGFYDHRE